MEQSIQKESWEIDIRTDLWHTMNSHQLTIQQDLILHKLVTLSKLGPTHPVARDITIALQRALEQLNNIITASTDAKKRTII